MKENNSSEWNVPVMICFPTNGTAAVVLLNECHFVVVRAESSGRPMSQYGLCGARFHSIRAATLVSDNRHLGPFFPVG